MPAPPPHRATLFDIPEEHQPIPANAGKSGIVRRDRDVEDRVSVGFVFLDRGRGFNGVRAGGVWDRAGYMDGTIGGAG